MNKFRLKNFKDQKYVLRRDDKNCFIFKSVRYHSITFEVSFMLPDNIEPTVGAVMVLVHAFVGKEGKTNTEGTHTAEKNSCPEVSGIACLLVHQSLNSRVAAGTPEANRFRIVNWTESYNKYPLELVIVSICGAGCMGIRGAGPPGK